MTLSILVAMGRNRVIGRDNRLPWRLPVDLQRFKTLTMNHAIIMGRKTYDSIGRALPGRRSFVLSRSTRFHPEGVTVVRSLDEALAACEGEDEVFVIGGGSLYQEALQRADRLYLTQIEADFEGDVFFPEVDLGEWNLVAEERYPSDEGNPYSVSFRTYERR